MSLTLKHRGMEAREFVGKATICDGLDYALCGCGKHVVLRLSYQDKPAAVLEVTKRELLLICEVLEDEALK